MTDEEALEVISSEVKKRKEACVEYEKGGRTDLIEQEKKEIEIIQKYLPEQLSEGEIKKSAKEAIKKVIVSFPVTLSNPITNPISTKIIALIPEITLISKKLTITAITIPAKKAHAPSKLPFTFAIFTSFSYYIDAFSFFKSYYYCFYYIFWIIEMFINHCNCRIITK